MSFDQRFELTGRIAESMDQADLALAGRQMSSGRLVTIHLLAGGHNPANEALLADIAALPPQYQVCFVEAGDHNGTPYVVTDPLAGNPPLRQWMAGLKPNWRRTRRPIQTTSRACVPGRFRCRPLRVNRRRRPSPNPPFRSRGRPVRWDPRRLPSRPARTSSHGSWRRSINPRQKRRRRQFRTRFLCLWRQRPRSRSPRLRDRRRWPGPGSSQDGFRRRNTGSSRRCRECRRSRQRVKRRGQRPVPIDQRRKLGNSRGC